MASIDMQVAFVETWPLGHGFTVFDFYTKI